MSDDDAPVRSPHLARVDYAYAAAVPPGSGLVFTLVEIDAVAAASEPSTS